MTTRQESPSDADIVRFLRFAHPKGGSAFADGETWESRDGEWRRAREWRASDAARRDQEKHLREVEAVSRHILADGKRAERIYDATPSWDDLKAEIPGLNVIEHPDGSKSAHFRDTTLDLRQKKRLGEMFGEARELEIEKSEDVSSRVETVTVGKGRRKKKVPVFSAEKADREARAS